MTQVPFPLPPQTFGEITDWIERIREELLIVQNALQKLHPGSAADPDRPEEPK